MKAPRIILMQVADVQTEDDIRMAIEIWNESHSDRIIRVALHTSFIVVLPPSTQEKGES